jgi:hypothetical protein
MSILQDSTGATTVKGNVGATVGVEVATTCTTGSTVVTTLGTVVTGTALEKSEESLGDDIWYDFYT